MADRTPVNSTAGGDDEPYESRITSGIRRGCLYVLVGVVLVPPVSFLLLMLWERLAG